MTAIDRNGGNGRVNGRRNGQGLRAGAAALAALAGAAAALAGGTPENILLVIDPSRPESLYVGHYYKNARNIPDANVLYMDPDAASYAAFAAGQRVGFLGELVQRSLEDHIDYVVVAPGPSFYVSAPGLVSDGCFPVSRFSMSSMFTMARLDEDIAGSPSSTMLNHYYSTNVNAPTAFDSVAAWRFGAQSGADTARRYYIGAMLGYTGERGNSVPQIISMIDRSVAADGTLPDGTFYYMNNTADPARNVRSDQFAGAEAAVESAGYDAEILAGVLPAGRHDALGIMTGAASVPVGATDMTLLAGSYAEHLTSYGATFDNGQQTKISAWISKGASGSSGAVEEPCNYTGKFSHAVFHALYARGLSLGESYLRTMQYVPFQNLLLGDPMARPFAILPTVSLPGAPTDPVSGTIFLMPVGSTTAPGADIFGYELLIDGVSQGVDLFGSGYLVDTTELDDGWHDLRVLAYDNTFVRSTGRWTGSLVVNNRGRAAAVQATPASGNLAQSYTFNVSVSGPGEVREVRLLQNGRVVAASDDAPASFTLRGHALGAGASKFQPEVLYADGRAVRGEPRTVTISFTGASSHATPPVAYGYTKIVTNPAEPFVVELPATFDGDPSEATYTILSGPAKSTVAPTGTGAFRVLIPGSGACGTDEMTFRVTTPGGQSNTSTVRILYGAPTPCRADMNGNGSLDVGDFTAFRSAYLAGDMAADFNGNCTLDVGDFTAFRAEYLAGCP